MEPEPLDDKNREMLAELVKNATDDILKEGMINTMGGVDQSHNEIFQK